MIIAILLGLVLLLTPAASVTRPEPTSSCYPFRFAVISDFNYDSPNMDKTYLKVVEQLTTNIKPKFVVFAGDMVGGDSKEPETNLRGAWTNLQGTIQQMKQAGIAVFPSAGNHDLYPKKSGLYQQTWKGYSNSELGFELTSGSYDSYYSFEYCNNRFISLYVPDRNPGKTQLSWLKEEVANRIIKANLFVFGHKSVRGQIEKRKQERLSKNAVKLLANVNAYISGHDHVFTDKVLDGVRYISSGTANSYDHRALIGETEKQPASFVIVDVYGPDRFKVHGVKGPDFTTTFGGQTLLQVSAGEGLTIPLQGRPAQTTSMNIADYGLYARYCQEGSPDIKQIITQPYPKTSPPGAPTFSAITTTAFFIPRCRKNQVWMTGEWDRNKDTYPTACDVPVAKRGFYEEVKCEGIGVCRNKQYGPNIGTTEGVNGHVLAPDKNRKYGETSCGTDPKPRRTIAVNSRPGTQCHVPYGSFVYLEYGENNPYNGWYIAEHTNAALQGKCAIDIFVKDKDEYKDAAPWVQGKQPQVWVFPPGGQAPITRGIFDEAVDAQKQPVGIYSVKPSFNVEVDFPMTQFETVQNLVFDEGKLVDQIEDCEKKGESIENCVSHGINQINAMSTGITFVEGPCDPEENIKSDFVEGYHACLDGQDTNCVCAITLKQAPQNSDQPKITIILPESLETPEGGTGIDQYISTMQGQSVENIGGSIKFKKEKRTITIGQNERSKIVHFYKTDASLAHIKDSSGAGIRACGIAKRTYKFCAMSTAKKYMVSDEGETSLRYIEHKFALTFPDQVPPPAIEGITVFGEPMADSSLVVRWLKSPAEDVKKYDIFLAPSADTLFSPLESTESIRLEVDIKSFNNEDAETLSHEPVLDSCVWDIGTNVCMYLIGGQEQALERNKLYYVAVKDPYYFTIINVEKGETYDVSVVAIDNFGNELENEFTPLPVNDQNPTQDKLPPSIVGGLTVELDAEDANIVILKWNKPQINLDGTPLDDLAGFGIFNGPLGAENLNSMTEMLQISLEEAGCDFAAATQCSYTLNRPNFPTIAVSATDISLNAYKEAAEIVQVP